MKNNSGALGNFGDLGDDDMGEAWSGNAERGSWNH